MVCKHTRHSMPEPEICEERILDSPMTFEGVDYGWATRYIALNMTQQQINLQGLHRIIPRKIAKSGKRPTVRTYEKEEKSIRWRYSKDKTPDKLDERERRKVMSKVVGIIVRTTMSNHFYKWGNEIKLQMAAGNIGLHATGCIARVGMDKWVQMFNDTLRKN